MQAIMDENEKPHVRDAKNIFTQIENLSNVSRNGSTAGSSGQRPRESSAVPVSPPTANSLSTLRFVIQNNAVRSDLGQLYDVELVQPLTVSQPSDYQS